MSTNNTAGFNGGTSNRETGVSEQEAYEVTVVNDHWTEDSEIGGFGHEITVADDQELQEVDVNTEDSEIRGFGHEITVADDQELQEVDVNRATETTTQNEKENQLSDLPLDLRVKVLSLLPSLRAVQTCILSTEWQSNWKKINSIYISDDAPLRQPRRLSLFCDKLMPALESQTFVRFCLRIRHSSMSEPTQWIDDAISRNLRELDADLFALQPPISFFTCGSLEKLTLRLSYWGCDPWEHPIWDEGVAINLPKLSSLDISAHRSVSSNMVRIIGGSPMLETLTLASCHFLPSSSHIRESFSLKTLKFVDSTLYGTATVLHVLDSFPGLEHLCVGKLQLRDWPERTSNPTCLAESLKTLTMTCYRGVEEPEFEFMLFVFTSANNLRKLMIKCDNDMSRKEVELAREGLNILTSLSRECDILFYDEAGGAKVLA